MFNPFGALATIIVGFKGISKADEWFRLGASVFMTAFINFWGGWGLAGLAIYKGAGEAVGLGFPADNALAALVGGFLCGSVAMAVSVLLLWKRSPLTKGTSILALGRIEEEAIKKLGEEGVSYSEKPK